LFNGFKQFKVKAILQLVYICNTNDYCIGNATNEQLKAAFATVHSQLHWRGRANAVVNGLISLMRQALKLSK